MSRLYGSLKRAATLLLSAPRIVYKGAAGKAAVYKGARSDAQVYLGSGQLWP